MAFVRFVAIVGGEAGGERGCVNWCGGVLTEFGGEGREKGEQRKNVQRERERERDRGLNVRARARRQ